MAVAGASGVNSVDAAVPRLGSGAYFDAEKMDAAFASSPFRASSLIDRGAALQSAASRAQRDAAVQDSLLWLKGREARTPLRAQAAAFGRASRSHFLLELRVARGAAQPPQLRRRAALCRVRFCSQETAERAWRSAPAPCRHAAGD